MSYFPITRQLFVSAFVVLAAAAQAETVTLGAIAAPLSWPIGQDAPVGALSDRFTFSVGDDVHLTFSSFVNTTLNQ